MSSRYVLGDGTAMTLADIAFEIDGYLLESSVGPVVQEFRRNDMMPLLEEVLPYLSLGNRIAIEAVLCEDIGSLYY